MNVKVMTRSKKLTIEHIGLKQLTWQVLSVQAVHEMKASTDTRNMYNCF